MSDEHQDPRIASWLEDEAPSTAGAGLSDRIMETVRRSPRTTRWRVWLRSPVAQLAGAGAAIGIAVVAYLAISSAQSPSPMGSAPPEGSPAPTITPLPTGTPSESPEPTATQPEFEGDVWDRAEIEAPEGSGGFTPAWPRDIVIGGPGLVAVGSVTQCCADASYDDVWGAAVWTSADGRRWELVDDLDSFGKAGLRAVAADDRGLMVAIGYEVLRPGPSPIGDLYEMQARVWRSTNGVDWISTPAPPPEASLYDIAWSPHGWVAVGGVDDQPTIFTSTDLQSWTAHAFDRIGELTEVAAGTDGSIVAIGCTRDEIPEADGCSYLATRTDDGQNWEEGGLVALASDLVANPDGGFVAVGSFEGAPASWSSEDGLDWEAFTYPSLGGARFDTATPTPNGILAATSATGQPVGLWMSSDGGRSWSQISELASEPDEVEATVSAMTFRDAQHVLLGTVFRLGSEVAAWRGF